MMTGTGPAALAGVVSVISMSTLIDGNAELSTRPTSDVVVTGRPPTFSAAVDATRHSTFGTVFGTRPYTSRSKSSTISGRRVSHQVFASVTRFPLLSTSGSGSFEWGPAFASS